jgi:hypothetical protein
MLKSESWIGRGIGGLPEGAANEGCQLVDWECFAWRNMTLDSCPTCSRLSKFYDDCLASIQRLKDLAQTARDSKDRQKADSLAETARSLENEATELLIALSEHRKRNHSAPPQ